MENPYELLYMARMKDPFAMAKLLEEFEAVIQMTAAQLSAVNYDVDISREELEQEGRISFFTAVDEFRHDKEAAFSTYCTIVIRRGMLSAIRHYGRKECLRRSHLIHLDAGKDGEGGSVDSLADRSGMLNPEYRAEYERAKEKLADIVAHMSEGEKRVLQVWQEGGCSYEESARRLGITPKSYDGLLQRLRRKLRRILEDDN